jgi:hypothetical protein
MAALVSPLCGKQETHIHDISNTYVPFPQLFAKGKSLKSEGIGMPWDLAIVSIIGPQLGHAEPKVGNPHSAQYAVSREFLDYPVIIQ